MKKGLLFVMSGPSGVGKGSIRELIIDDESLNLGFSISMTTRNPRKNEQDGVHYFFKNEEQFLEAVKNDELLEYAVFDGNYYGTPKAYVEKLRNEGKNVLLEIEVDGAKQVKEKVADQISIFITPPSMEELEKRIRGRNTQNEESIQTRLAKARNEMKLVGEYKYTVCNDDLKLASELVKTIMKHYIQLNEQ